MSKQSFERGVVKLPNGLSFKVDILEKKISFGRTRWKVKPVAGSGEAIIENLILEKNGI